MASRWRCHADDGPYQEDVLAAAPPRLRPDRSPAELQRRFGADRRRWREFAAKNDARPKQTSSATLPIIGTAFGQRRRGMIRADRIHAVLRRAGCPTSPEQIGLTSAFYATAVRNARFLRDRYTFLDLADDSGQRALMGA
jgi:glycerol-1-phosphate dehydrogenase [NAD(P)+]